MGDQISKMFRVQTKLKQTLKRDPTHQELAVELGLTPDRVEKMLRYARHPLSLDMSTSFEDDSVLGDFIEDQESIPPSLAAEESMLKQDLHQMLNRLPAREVQILKLRYGLTGGKRHTLQEVGEKLGVTRERIRQIESQALRRLRHPGIRKKLQSYLGHSKQ
jgi:RNA polymerase primary sigma factor